MRDREREKTEKHTQLEGKMKVDERKGRRGKIEETGIEK